MIDFKVDKLLFITRMFRKIKLKNWLKKKGQNQPPLFHKSYFILHGIPSTIEILGCSWLIGNLLNLSEDCGKKYIALYH